MSKTTIKWNKVHLKLKKVNIYLSDKGYEGYQRWGCSWGCTQTVGRRWSEHIEDGVI